MRTVREGSIYYATQIKEDIRTKILSGRLQSGEKLPPEGELASSYGVSRMTLRQALVELVVEGFIYRIPGKGTFVADILSFDSRKGTLRNIVTLIVPNLTLSFYYQIISGIEKILKSHNMDMVLSNVNEDPMEEKVALEKIIKSPTGGVLLITGEHTKENINLLKEIIDKVPMVILDVKVEGVKADTVVSDDRMGGYLATEHLIEIGHRDILHLSGPEGDSSADTRRYGYREAIEKHNIEYREEYIRYTHWHREDGYYQTKKFFMSNGDKVTGIFACNDEVAAGCYKALKEMGIGVPEDVALIGYGNLDIGRFLEVPLSSVEQSAEDMGKEGAKLLIDKLTGRRKADDIKEVVIPTKLVIRESCGISKKVDI